MDVSCSRCHAEYEFDDALISERGTTVFCTACGLKFKIYAAEKRGVPEEWTLTPIGAGTVQRTFRSLRELQRAILEGEVHETDLLARGGEQARTLGTIAELEPLLKRPRSAPPPDVRERSMHGGTKMGGTKMGLAGMPGAGVRRTAGGTVMGLAAPRVPNFGAAPPPDSRPPVRDVDGDADDIVPSSPADSDASASQAAEPWQPPPTQTLRPRIQSVLSRSPPLPPAPEPLVQGETPSSSRLRAVLAPSASAPSGGAGGSPDRGSLPPESLPEPPVSRQSRFDSEPFGVGSSPAQRPLARGGWIVVSVLVGATAFVLTAARERVFSFFDAGAQKEAAPALAKAEHSVKTAVELADEAWLRARIAPSSERAAKVAALEARLLSLKQLLEDGARGPLARTATWVTPRVHYLRMLGDVPGARAALGQTKGTPVSDPYLLAMLDFADRSDKRPFPSILGRLKDVSAGERGPYRMRSAYIVALVEAGRLAQAREEFERMAQNADAANAPLYGDLARYLEAESRLAAEQAEESGGPEMKAPASEATQATP